VKWRWGLLVLGLGLCSLLVLSYQGWLWWVIPPKTDKQIVKKYLGPNVGARYNAQGRVIAISCPKIGGGLIDTYILPRRPCKQIGGQLPPEFGQLTELRSLKIFDRSLHTLPPELGNLTKLEFLWILGELTSLPPEIGHLSSLKTLRLRANNLSILPPEIGDLANLEELDLAENELTSLPPEMGQLTSLQTLNLMNNNLTTLPAEIGQLKNLREFRLYINPLKSLPSEIWEMENTHIGTELRRPYPKSGN
jgi:hypothetical protein